MNKIMVVEDDVYLREEIIDILRKEGYSVASISSFDSVEKQIIVSSPDLVVLDLNLPGKSGFELCRLLKGRTVCPVLILTARDTLTDELRAIGLGADDFLAKPCHPARLTARVERLLSTYKRMRNIIQAGALSLDLDTCKVEYCRNSVSLPETESRIMEVLITRFPDVVPAGDIFCFVWGGEEYVDENVLQVNVARLRKKLSGCGITGVIQTMRGKGYYLEVEEL